MHNDMYLSSCQCWCPFISGHHAHVLAHSHIHAHLQSNAQALAHVDAQACRVLFISQSHTLTHACAPVPAHAHTQADVHSLDNSDPPPHPHSDLKRAGGIVWAGRADYGCRWQITHGQSGGHNHKGKNLKSFASSLSSSYSSKGFESHGRM